MKREAPAAARNREPIGDILENWLSPSARVLEIASGTGEHACYLSSRIPLGFWQPTDISDEALASIDAWQKELGGMSSLGAARRLDVCERETWPEVGHFDVIVCINMIHISPWRATTSLFELATHCLVDERSVVYLYGPYLEQDRETAPSNLAFDQSLKARNGDWGLRSLEDVDKVAEELGWHRVLREEMPANNLSLIYRRHR